jgi:P27 family predicted phage terminase small subunit
MTSADFAAFACYCAAYSQFIASQRILKDEGLTFMSPNGYLMARPEIAISNTAMKLIKDFSIQFGFTPSSRGRIQLPDAGDGDGEDLD